MGDQAWNDLDHYQKEWDNLLKREAEIRKEWHATQDNEIKKQLENELKELPFSEIQRKMAEAMRKCGCVAKKKNCPKKQFLAWD
ncbi:MAG: hypothetical protein LEGION0403_FIIPPAGN_02616 [Legionella sp.]|uniref:hypothetical protein n=1 Tax=Legionella sp. TaxID=459 RepID=UPI003D0B84A1